MLLILKGPFVSLNAKGFVPVASPPVREDGVRCYGSAQQIFACLCQRCYRQQL